MDSSDLGGQEIATRICFSFLLISLTLYDDGSSGHRSEDVAGRVFLKSLRPLPGTGEFDGQKAANDKSARAPRRVPGEEGGGREDG